MKKIIEAVSNKGSNIRPYEGPDPEVDYYAYHTGPKEEAPVSKVLAILAKQKSGDFATLANKLVKIEEQLIVLSEQAKKLKDEQIRRVEELFNPEDKMRTCVVMTASCAVTISALPKLRETTQYKKILEELNLILPGELKVALQKLVEAHTNVAKTPDKRKVSIAPFGKSSYKEISKRPSMQNDEEELNESVDYSVKEYENTIKKICSFLDQYIETVKKLQLKMLKEGK